MSSKDVTFQGTILQQLRAFKNRVHPFVLAAISDVTCSLYKFSVTVPVSLLVSLKHFSTIVSTRNNISKQPMKRTWFLAQNNQRIWSFELFIQRSAFERGARCYGRTATGTLASQPPLAATPSRRSATLVSSTHSAHCHNRYCATVVPEPKILLLISFILSLYLSVYHSSAVYYQQRLSRVNRSFL